MPLLSTTKPDCIHMGIPNEAFTPDGLMSVEDTSKIIKEVQAQI